MKLMRLDLARNILSITGAALTTVSALIFLVVFGLDLLGMHTNPYMGIVFFLILPTVFVFGLVLIPIGVWIERRRRHLGKGASEIHWPRLDLNDPQLRRTTLLVMSLTFANVVIVSLAAYRGIEYMDSVGFCGQLCHEVMQPEFAAYQDGPHSRVACVGCHIGPGASWFVRSKLSGVRQVAAVTLNTHSRPIPSPVENLRPAREVCEQCHWPEKFHGDKADVRRTYADDEANTESVQALRIHVGGGTAQMGIATGIHWHMSVANEIEYIATDEKRQTIGYVRMRDAQGNVKEFYAEGVTEAELQQGQRRRMDCMDCHNRPSHPFDATPERAVDRAIARGEIPQALPYVRREAVAAVNQIFPDQDVASDTVATNLRRFYREQYPDVYSSRRQDVERAVAAAQRIYRRNIFPSMKVGWGSYPNNIGHMDFPGCFRCHDESHTTKSGETISQDCGLCHTLE